MWGGVLPLAWEDDTMGRPFTPSVEVFKKGTGRPPGVHKLSKERSGGGARRRAGSRAPSYLARLSVGRESQSVSPQRPTPPGGELVRGCHRIYARLPLNALWTVYEHLAASQCPF
jgi:hypothetical protein